MPALNELAPLNDRLSRAVTYDHGIGTVSLEDDLRIIQKIGAKFLGRAAFVWNTEADDEEHFVKSRRLAERVHAMDPDIVLQAAVFECVDRGADRICVPDWVFRLMGEVPEDRTFCYDQMRSGEFSELYNWGTDSGVPDIRQAETRRWFVYRCCRYIEAGYEAIHLGQPHLYAGRDVKCEALSKVIEIVRAFASRHARRSVVLLDAHTHGFAVNGRLLFDFHSMPISARPDLKHPERLILQNRCRSLGGITPAGETCRSAPQLIEVDNYGGLLGDGQWDDQASRANKGRWGYDDIAWLAHQPEEERNHFLRYAHEFYRVAGSNVYFQPPLRRTLGRAPVRMNDPLTGKPCDIAYYQANHCSKACPEGFGQEEVIAECFTSPSPIWLEDYRQHMERINQGDRIIDRNGVSVNEPVTMLGTIQTALGGWVGDPQCVYSRLRHVGEGVFELAALIPRAGTYEIAIALGGTVTDVFRETGIAGRPPWRLVIERDIIPVLFRFDHATRRLTVSDAAGESILF